MPISVCTFNVNSIRSRIDLILRWLREKREIDLLCLQEIKCEEERFPHEAFESLGYRCAVNGQKRLNGVAICSKLPLSSVQTSFEDETLDREKRLIQARVGNTTLINCYIPRGGPEEGDRHRYKMRFFERLASHVETLMEREKSLLLLGDLNVALDDLDVYDPAVFEGAVGFLPSEKRMMRKLLERGLNDCYRRLHPDTRAFTWWDYRSAAIWRDEGMRIDYILASDSLCEACLGIEVDLWTRRRRSPTPSDHAPIVARFEHL